MKTPITIPSIASLLGLALITIMPLKAQDSATQDSLSSPVVSTACSGKHGKGHDKEWLASLNDQERSQLKAAMKQVKNDPQLVAAREAVKDAQTKEARAAAHETLRQTRRDLLLKADPSLATVLEKIKEAKQAKPTVS